MILKIIVFINNTYFEPSKLIKLELIINLVIDNFT